MNSNSDYYANLNKLKQADPKIYFIKEKEPRGIIAFLDVGSTKMIVGYLCRTVFRKPAWAG